MHLLSTLAVVVAVTCYQRASASTIFFQASPSTFYPVLTKSLKLRCSVEVEPGTNLVRRQGFPAHTATSTTLPPATNVSWTHTVSYPMANTTTHRAPTSHRPTITQADVSHIMSIIIARQDRVTGKLQTVARVSAYDPASASVDLDNIKVAGDTNGSLIPREKGYLEITWAYPAQDQSTEYFCDIYGLDATLHPVSLTSETRITSPQVTVSELAAFVAQNQRYVTELQASLADVTGQLAQLQAESRAEIRALNDTIDSLQNRTEHIKAQNIQTGAVACTSTSVTFPRPFERTPTVFASITVLQLSQAGYSWNVAVTIQSVTTTGFTLSCTSGNIFNSNIQWVALDN